MSLLRFLIAVGCVLLSLSGWMLQQGPRDALIDLCPWIEPLAHTCPKWLSGIPLPDSLPWALYAIAGLGLLFMAWPLFSGSLAQAPEDTLAQFIQRGRDLHARCRKEGDQAVLPDIHAWTDEVSQFLRRLGHRYVIAFGDFGSVQLFASQYDTAASLEIRQRIQRLSEFLQRFRESEGQSA
jgi:hypothetical protein